VESYFQFVISKIKAAEAAEAEHIETAAETIARSFLSNRSFFTFGTGHSHMIAEELYLRAGGLAFVKAILPPEMMLHQGIHKSTILERIEGYGEVILNLYHVGPGDTILIVSNSGRNSVPVEMALGARKRGASVIALTSLKHSRRTASRHSSGKKLYEIADLVLDNQAEYGDAAYPVKGSSVLSGPTSSIVGIALVQAAALRAAEIIARKGTAPPLLRSSNADDADEYNDVLLQKYQNGAL
jgi:uncharacterized phosphosugar-binding protein